MRIAFELAYERFIGQALFTQRLTRLGAFEKGPAVFTIEKNQAQNIAFREKKALTRKAIKPVGQGVFGNACCFRGGKIANFRVRQQVGVPHGAHHRRILEGEKKRGMRGPATRSAFWGCRACKAARDEATKEAREARRRRGELKDWDDWKQEDSEPPQASLAHILSGSCAGNKEEARHFMRKLDKHTARATARVEREAPDSKDTATFLRRARAASLKAMGSRFRAVAEEEYDKIAPVIACTLPALTDSIPERKRRELAGEVTSELQVVGKAASIAIQTWVRNNDKTKARAEEREKNIGWIKRLFTAWRVSHTERTERRAERKEDGEDDSEEDEPVEIQLSDVTMHPKGTPAPASSVEARVFEERVDLSNNMTCRQK